MANHPRSLSISDHLNLFVLKLLSIVKLLLLFFTSFLKYLPVTFSGWLARSKHHRIYFYCGYCLFILLYWLNPLRCGWPHSPQDIPYLFKEDNHQFVAQRYDLNRYYSHQRSYFHPTSDKLGHENRRRVLVAEVDGEPVSGYETPIIESDKPFVPSRELSNDIAQTEDLFGLPDALGTEIFKKLPAFHDFAFCSTVCRRWRSACLNMKWSLYPPHPWSIHFQGQNIMNHLDDGRYVLEKWKIDGRYYYGCVNGWILSIGSKHISIFNLFSRTQRNLPKLNPVGYLKEQIKKPIEYWYSHIEKFILFKVGQGDYFQFLVVALFAGRGLIAFTRSSGFQDWIYIESDDIACCRDVVLFQEQFYALCGRGKLFLCVFNRYKPIASLVSGQPAGSFRAYKYYLVKNVDHLIAVFQYGVKRFGPVTFSIYRFDGTFIREPINLEGRALFISNGNSWTIDPKEVESCRTNSIYFVDDYWFSNNRNGHFIGVFDIANRKFEDFQFEKDQYPPNDVSPFSLTENVGA